MKKIFSIILFSILCIFYTLAQTPDANEDQNSITFGHVALAVKDLDKAILWYQNVLGFQLTKKPVEIDTDTSPLGEIAKTLFGSDIKKLRIAQMTMRNQVGLELFEFVLPRSEDTDNDDFRKSGFLHICVISTDIDELVKKLEENGGKVKVEYSYPNSRQKVVFCEDPDGNIIEIKQEK